MALDNDVIKRIIGARGINPALYPPDSGIWGLIDNGFGPEINLWNTGILGALPSPSEIALGETPLITLNSAGNLTSTGFIYTATLTEGSTETVNWRIITPLGETVDDSEAVDGESTREVLLEDQGTYLVQAWSAAFGFAEMTYLYEMVAVRVTKHATDPATPALGDILLFGRPDGKLYTKDDQDVVTSTTPITDHTELSNIGENTHAEIDAHLANDANPHGVTAGQVGNATAQWNANQLQGQAIATTTPANGQFLGYNGSQWGPATPPDHDGFIGQISMDAAPTPESGWLPCDGRELSRSTYAALYARIEDTWGAGDGTTTFNIPNLASVFPRGANGGSIPLGGSGGANTVTLAEANLPAKKQSNLGLGLGATVFVPLGGGDPAPTAIDTVPAFKGVNFVIKVQ